MRQVYDRMVEAVKLCDEINALGPKWYARIYLDLLGYRVVVSYDKKKHSVVVSHLELEQALFSCLARAVNTAYVAVLELIANDKSPTEKAS